MKAHTTSAHPSIALITAKIEEHHALAKDFAADQTLKLAEAALEQAKAAAAEAELEDDSTDPEELVDRRLEARRQVEIAEIRLVRAKKATQSQGHQVMWPINKAGKIAADALREVSEPFGDGLEAALRKLIGDETYDADRGFFNSLIYRKKERLYTGARLLESSASVPGLGNAIAMLEDVARLG